GVALARDDVVVQLIVDGVHLAPETAIVTWRAAPGRVALVIDSITAAGESEGEYSFGSLDVQVHERAVRGPDGVLAGSVLTMINTLPASTPSGPRTARSCTCTSRLPNEYSPSLSPAAVIESITSATLPGAARHVTIAVSGARCTPSTMSWTTTSSRASAT